MPVLSLLDATDCPPMTDAQQDLLFRCIVAESKRLMDDKLPPDEFTEAAAEKCGPVGVILFGRLQLAGPVLVSVPCALFCLTEAGGNPGDIVQWAYALNRLWQRQRRIVTCSDLCDAFPMGFPTKADYERLWDAQKARLHEQEGDNMLDKAETWALGEPETATHMPRVAHLNWAKERARVYLRQGKPSEAVASMITDLRKHPEMRDMIEGPFGMIGVMSGRSLREATDYIEGFN